MFIYSRKERKFVGLVVSTMVFRWPRKVAISNSLILLEVAQLLNIFQAELLSQAFQLSGQDKVFLQVVKLVSLVQLFFDCIEFGFLIQLLKWHMRHSNKMSHSIASYTIPILIHLGILQETCLGNCFLSIDCMRKAPKTSCSFATNSCTLSYLQELVLVFKNRNKTLPCQNST